MEEKNKAENKASGAEATLQRTFSTIQQKGILWTSPSKYSDLVVWLN